jgi:hypothetical protein
MTFWAEDAFCVEDQVNDDIWARSPGVQRQIQLAERLAGAAVVGAQQAMLPADPTGVLPWVPDVLGAKWQAPDALIIFGSAYAGFIRECSPRRNTMPLAEYASAQSWQQFAERFRRQVVVGDSSYYGPIERLVRLTNDGTDASRIALIDLCRASFVRRDVDGPRRRDKSGDRVVLDAPAVFHPYVEHNDVQQWTWARLTKGQAKRIVALGTIAEHGLLRLFARFGCRIRHSSKETFCQLHDRPEGDWVTRYAQPGYSLGRWLSDEAWWEVSHGPSGRRWTVLPVTHPARSQGDPGYKRVAALLRQMST